MHGKGQLKVSACNEEDSTDTNMRIVFSRWTKRARHRWMSDEAALYCFECHYSSAAFFAVGIRALAMSIMEGANYSNYQISPVSHTRHFSISIQRI